VKEARENGLKRSMESVKESFKKNVLVHFQSRENFKSMVASLKQRIDLGRVSESLQGFVQRLNQSLLDIMSGKKQEKQTARKESQYWR